MYHNAMEMVKLSFLTVLIVIHCTSLVLHVLDHLCQSLQFLKYSRNASNYNHYEKLTLS